MQLSSPLIGQVKSRQVGRRFKGFESQLYNKTNYNDRNINNKRWTKLTGSSLLLVKRGQHTVLVWRDAGMRPMLLIKVNCTMTCVDDFFFFSTESTATVSLCSYVEHFGTTEAMETKVTTDKFKIKW